MESAPSSDGNIHGMHCFQQHMFSNLRPLNLQLETPHRPTNSEAPRERFTNMYLLQPVSMWWTRLISCYPTGFIKHQGLPRSIHDRTNGTNWHTWNLCRWWVRSLRWWCAADDNLIINKNILQSWSFPPTEQLLPEPSWWRPVLRCASNGHGRPEQDGSWKNDIDDMVQPGKEEGLPKTQLRNNGIDFIGIHRLL